VAALKLSPRDDLGRVMIPRFSPLMPWLSGEKSASFLEIDNLGHSVVPFGNDQRLRVVQYILSPVLIRRTEQDPDCPLVIVDSDDGNVFQELASERGWTILVDLGNGVRLFRQAKGE